MRGRRRSTQKSGESPGWRDTLWIPRRGSEQRRCSKLGAVNARNPDQHTFQSVVPRYGRYAYVLKLRLALSPIGTSLGFSGGITASHVICNPLQANKYFPVCRTQRQPATVATAPNGAQKNERAKARIFLRSTGSCCSPRRHRALVWVDRRLERPLTTLAGSGRRYKVCRFKNKGWDTGHSLRDCIVALRASLCASSAGDVAMPARANWRISARPRR